MAIGAVAAFGAAVAVKAIDDEQKKINTRKRKQQNKKELRYDPTKPCSISIMSDHGKFMGCKGSKVHCHSKQRGNAETFISIPIPNEDSNDISVRIALKTFQSKYLSVQPKDGSIECNRDNIGKQETFIVERIGHKKSDRETWSFKSGNGHYFSAQMIGGKLVADRDRSKSWEQFLVQIVDWDDDDWE